MNTPTPLQIVADLAKEITEIKTAIAGITSDVSRPLDERWELFRASPYYLKENLTTAWDPELHSVGVPKIHWINIFGCNPGETCDPAELLEVALEDEDPGEGTIQDALQKRPLVLQAFKEAILKDNVGTFICGSHRYYS